MTEHSTQFESTDGGLALTRAILLYQAGAGRQSGARGAAGRPAPAFASVHPVELHDGRPVIGAGAPLSRAHLRHWTEALGKTTVPEILPANVLVSHPDMLAWWVPQQVRPGYFALSKREGLRALAQRAVVPVPYPAHLFIATRSGLGVYALPVSERPSAETVVLHSPILNVFLQGTLCWGNIPKPKTLSVVAIAEFERAVFDSWSTHPNPGQENTVSGKGGLVRLWDDLATRKAKVFPVRRLKPFDPRALRSTAAEPITLGKLIAASARA